MTTPVLDRIPFFDPRSKEYSIRSLFAAANTSGGPRLWTPGPTIDQGSEGACVGFGWSQELASSPMRVQGIDDAFALEMYRRAQAKDRAEGRFYSSGATVLAGAKAVQELGYQTGYRWAFTIQDLIQGVLQEGPCVTGVDWLDGMYDTRPSGMVDVSGTVVGGHCITIIGYHPGMRIKGEGWMKRHEVFIWKNSWGPSYGKNGIGYLKVEDVANRLFANGEFCFPIHRKKKASVA